MPFKHCLIGFSAVAYWMTYNKSRGQMTVLRASAFHIYAKKCINHWSLQVPVCSLSYSSWLSSMAGLTLKSYSPVCVRTAYGVTWTMSFLYWPAHIPCLHVCLPVSARVHINLSPCSQFASFLYISVLRNNYFITFLMYHVWQLRLVGVARRQVHALKHAYSHISYWLTYMCVYNDSM